MVINAERFWAKVAIGAEEECWLWQASSGRSERKKSRYGQFGCRYPDGEATMVGSHRVAYELAHGSIPQGMLVCHHCDEPLCCNPTHLFLGTPSDNARDMKLKGRAGRSGAGAARRNVLRPYLAEIKNSTETTTALAVKFGVTPNAMRECRQKLRQATP